jgi:hypothetical protein
VDQEKSFPRFAALLSEAGYSTLLASRSAISRPLAHCKGVEFNWVDASTSSRPFNLRLGADPETNPNPICAVFLVAPRIHDCFPPMKIFIDLSIENSVRMFY